MAKVVAGKLTLERAPWSLSYGRWGSVTEVDVTAWVGEDYC